MLISTSELKALYSEFGDLNDKLLERKLSAIESVIRAHTHNRFTNNNVREMCTVNGKTMEYIYDNPHYLTVGDTVYVNRKIFNVAEVNENGIVVNEETYLNEDTLVTKVEYPVDIVEGAINILKWDMFERDNHEGISSESISRHSVSYVTYDATNTINGYPSKLFGFCEPYIIKVRT